MRKPTKRVAPAIVELQEPAGKSPAQTDTSLVALNTAPQAGSNSAVEGEVLISVEDAHEIIAQILAQMADTETTLEYARQRLAYDLWLRHIAMVATAPAGTVPMLHDLAGKKNLTAFRKYMLEIVAEFAGPLLVKSKCKTAELMRKYADQQKIEARVTRSLTLITHLAFAGLNTSAFDLQRGQWLVPYTMLVLPDYVASPDLIAAGNVYLEADTRDEYYFTSRPRMAPVAVSPSLTSVETAMRAQVERAHNPATPTVEDAGRKPRQPVAASGDAPAVAPTGNATPADASDDDEPGMDADKPVDVTKQTWACEQFAKAVIAAEKWANHDGMRNAKRADIGQSAFNAITVLRTLQDRMIHAEERAANKLAA